MAPKASAVGLVVEFSPATREARVRFPDCAKFFPCQNIFAENQTACFATRTGTD
jgi:hypothetical protein